MCITITLTYTIFVDVVTLWLQNNTKNKFLGNRNEKKVIKIVVKGRKLS